MPNLTDDQFTGPLRALIPAIVAAIVAHGWLPAWVPISDLDAFLIAMVMAIWSWHTNKPESKIKSLNGSYVPPTPPRANVT